MSKILVHLVHGPTDPNFIAARHIGADGHVFLFSPESNDRKEWLRALLGGENGLYTDKQIGPYDLVSITRACEEIYSINPADEIILNFSTGTPVMVAGAFNFFFSKKKECVYVRIEGAIPEIMRFVPDTPTVDISAVPVTITVLEHLQLSGHTIMESRERTVNGEMAEIRRFLLQEHLRCRAVIGQLQNQMKDFEQTGIAGPFSTMILTVGKTSIHWNAGHLRLEVRGKNEFHASLNGGGAAWYIVRGWMIDEIRATVAKIKQGDGAPYFRDITVNPWINWYNPMPWDDSGDERTNLNEIDLLAMHHCRPLVIECKTGTAWKEQLHQLVAVRDQLGRDTLALLVSIAGPLPDDMVVQAAALGLNIATLDTLESTLQQLITNSQ